MSNLSQPTDSTAELDSGQAPSSTEADSGGEEDPVVTMTSTPDGVTARLTWNHPSDINVAGYSIYYGKSSPEEPGSEESIAEESISEESTSDESISEELSSCSQGESQAVEAPPATITGLEPNTRYFFAIRAFNDSESICSNKITAVTPPAQS